MVFPAIPDERRWESMPLMSQMANIGSEVGRTLNWMSKSNSQMAMGAFIRALDIIDLTIKVGRKGQDNRDCLLKELCRCRDLFAQAFITSDLDTLKWVNKYFGQFALANSHSLSGK